MTNKSLFCIVLFVGMSLFNVFGRSRYLNDSVITGSHEEVFGEICSLAEKLAEKKCEDKKQQAFLKEQKRKAKLDRIAKKQIEAKKKEEKIRLARVERKCKAVELEFLRKANLLEKKRRLAIISWRYYRKNKKAAKVLMKEAFKVDFKNSLHVDELKREVSRFSDERMGGSLDKYPALGDFLKL